ncbi:DUF5667 domain-containing protein [Jatrophihabitans cynanchi]|uniref:DUF5667 domain-containing protein n=1 Tax=Jatrophihabitans cynanchi TaxID=2944128 RepID=UPI0022B23285|nr:DUF5667 domain-containing protein [Jatrophihabitans sp. SB3-54]
MAEHRVPLLGAALRRFEDPARSKDPQIRELVAALSSLEPGPAPRAEFRAELREQLVAVTPRLVAEGSTEQPQRKPGAAAPAGRLSRARAAARRVPQLHLARKVRFAVAALTVLTIALTGAVWLSRSALPGDALYGLKRAGENAQLSLTSGKVSRAKDLLSFAKTRADEVSSLLGNASASGTGPQADGAITERTASLVRSTLGSADDDVRQAAQLLGSQAVSARSAAPLQVMTGWAPAQQGRLDAIVARIPAGSLHDAAASSATLIASAYARARQLQAVIGCGCLDNAHSDDLGPLPCTACAGPAQPGRPGHSSGATPGSTGSTSSPRPDQSHSPAAPGGTGITPGGGTSAAPGSSPPGSSGSTGGPVPLPTPSLPLPGLPLPSLPLPTPSVTTDSCGASISLGPIGIGVGTCGIHIGI